MVIDAQIIQQIVILVNVIVGGFALWRTYKKDKSEDKHQTHQDLIRDYERVRAERNDLLARLDAKDTEIKSMKSENELLRSLVKKD